MIPLSDKELQELMNRMYKETLRLQEEKRKGVAVKMSVVNGGRSGVS